MSNLHLLKKKLFKDLKSKVIDVKMIEIRREKKYK